MFRLFTLSLAEPRRKTYTKGDPKDLSDLFRLPLIIRHHKSCSGRGGADRLRSLTGGRCIADGSFAQRHLGLSQCHWRCGLHRLLNPIGFRSRRCLGGGIATPELCQALQAHLLSVLPPRMLLHLFSIAQFFRHCKCIDKEYMDHYNASSDLMATTMTKRVSVSLSHDALRNYYGGMEATAYRARITCPHWREASQRGH